MAQVILIEDNKTLNELIAINLTTYLGVDIIDRKNAQETLNLLAILPTIDLIITNHKIGNEETSKLLAQYIEEHKLETGLIILGGNHHSDTSYSVTIENPKDWEKVVHTTAKILGINEKNILKNSIPDYIPVPVKYFLNLENTNCDIFIRIKKSPTEYQFIKRIHHNDHFTKDSIMRYLSQGLESFFIPKELYKDFTIFLSNSLVEKMERPNIEISTKLQLMGNAFEIATKEISQLGFTSETIQLTETIINGMIKNFEKDPEMSSLLHKVINTQSGLLFRRCHMTLVVASEVIKYLNIKDSNSLEKIAYAAFFHDICLIDQEELSKINTFTELEKAKLNEDDWELVFSHAIVAAELIRKHPEAPTGVDQLIKHHHGSSIGKGFSNTIDELPILSQIFIVAHHFVLELIHFKEIGGTPRPITEELYKRYPHKDTAKIINALEQTLKKKKKK